MVALSKTAMSNTVADDLNIFSTLSILMKLWGVFVKNELCYGLMSRLFSHSVFIYMIYLLILRDQD